MERFTIPTKQAKTAFDVLNKVQETHLKNSGQIPDKEVSGARILMQALLVLYSEEKMTDNEVIEATAQLWVSSGGDSEGFVWCWHEIIKRIREIEQENRDAEETA